MPVALAAIPLMAAVGTGAAAAVFTAGVTASFAAYATVAGAVLSTVGAVTKNKDLQRIGMFASLGAGIAGAVGGMSSAAASGADAATSAAWGSGAGLGGDTLSAVGSGVTEAGASTAASLAGNASNAAPSGFDFSAGGGSVPGSEAAQPMMAGATSQPTSPADAATSQAWSNGAGLGKDTMSAMGAPADPVAAAAKLITPEELNAFYNKAQKGVNSVGTWIGDNKELVKIGGEALNGAFGPQAQYVNLQRERWDSEKSLLARARERLNNPIRLNFGGA